jgi:hypothetical protein
LEGGRKLIKHINNSRKLIFKEKYFYFAYAAALPFFLFLFLSSEYASYQKEGYFLCYGDCFCSVCIASVLGLFFVPFVFFMACFLSERIFSSQMILRLKKRETVWNLQVIVLIKTAFYCSIYLTAWTAFLGTFFSNQILNWNKQRSIFFLTTQATVGSYSIGEIVLLFWLCSFLLFAAIPLCALLTQWISGKEIVGWLYLILITGWNMASPFKLLSGKLYLWYRSFLEPSIFAVGIFGCIGLIFVLWMIGKKQARRKDFWNA